MLSATLLIYSSFHLPLPLAGEGYSEAFPPQAGEGSASTTCHGGACPFDVDTKVRIGYSLGHCLERIAECVPDCQRITLVKIIAKKGRSPWLRSTPQIGERQRQRCYRQPVFCLLFTGAAQENYAVARGRSRHSALRRTVASGRLITSG